jgi:Asp-tRNA(Asn)/Glu-tRNA(Gln) amidotransferase A subunit family amidase
MDYWNLTIEETLAAFQRGEFLVSEYIEGLLERCERYRYLNAFISQDPERIIEAARKADRTLRSGMVSGMLHGIPILLKDNIDTADLPTTGGTPALKNHRPGRNAPIVQTLIDEGAIIFGKANLHELALGITNNNSAFGPVRNPFDPARIPGGSSGGCGAAVSAGLVPIGIGTDTGGSVRIPAALCGIVGFRPTIGRYPQAGIVPISHTRDTAGPMTRSVSDAVLMDRVISGSKDSVKPAKLTGMRLGVPRSPFYENIDPAVTDSMEAALSRFRNYGIDLVEADMPEVINIEEVVGFPIALYEIVFNLNRYLDEHGTGLDFSSLVAGVASPDVKSILERQLGQEAVPEALYRKAMHESRPALQTAYREYFAKNRLSGMVFPTTPLPAIPIWQDKTVVLNGEIVLTFPTFGRNTSPGSVAGIPGLSIPAGSSPDGLPIGVEIDGPCGKDDELLAMALAFEEREPSMAAPNLP